MDRLVDEGSLVGIDTSIFIYHLEGNPNYADLVRPFFAELGRGTVRGVTSVATLLEIAVRPLALGLPGLADAHESFLLEQPYLVVHDLNRSIARRAAALRALYRLAPMDSIQVATALGAEAAAFVTNDRGLQRVRELPVLILDDFRGR